MTQGRDTALDGLRGIAAFAVVLSHVVAMTWNPFYDGKLVPAAWQLALWHLGAPAVDVFLVLSGFVVTRAIARSADGYGGFVLGRLIRLYPVAWVAVLAGAALRLYGPGFPAGITSGMDELTKPLGALDVLGLSNLILPFPAINRINPPLWTLIIEMQAAFGMPILAWGARRNPVLLAICTIILAVLLTAAVGYPYPLYFVAFAIGSSFAVLEGRIPQAPRPTLVLVFFLALLLCRHYLNTEDPTLRVPCAIAAAGVILAIRQGAASRILRSRVAAWLGSVSYPLYAIHWPIMAFACATLGWRIGVTGAALASIPAALATAWAVERLIDRHAVALSRMTRRRA